MKKQKIINKVLAKLKSLDYFGYSNKIDTREKKTINQDLIKEGFDGNGKFKSIGRAHNKLAEILAKHSLEFDTVLDANMFKGDSGKKNLELARSTNDPFSPIPIENRLLSFSWYKRSEDNFEILAYISL